jgi:hypothetical protein
LRNGKRGAGLEEEKEEQGGRRKEEELTAARRRLAAGRVMEALAVAGRRCAAGCRRGRGGQVAGCAMRAGEVEAPCGE